MTPLEIENAKLREEIAKWERLASGIDLPEYPVTQFKPKDLERENAKLRELIRDMWHEMITCPDHRMPPCMTDSICERVRELEMEVNR